MCKDYMDEFEIKDEMFECLTFAYWVSNIHLHVSKDDASMSNQWIRDNILTPVEKMELM